MKIEQFKNNHIEDAGRILLAGYERERASVEILPHSDSHLDKLTGMAAGLVDDATGVPGFAAIEGGRLVGFLTGYPVKSFFSSRNGVYVPVHGQGAAGADRRLVYQRLYEAASGAWVGEGRLTHCVSMFAHDVEAVDCWYWLGFGLRCVDAIRPLSDVSGAGKASGLVVRKAMPEDADALYPLHTGHCGYYKNSPLFMPHVDVEGGLEEFRQWLAGEGNHLWAAYSDGKPVSYMRIDAGWGNFNMDESLMYNICGAFTAEAARGTGAGALLLAAIVEWMKGQGCVRLGVDYESFNIYGSRFWMKHFTPFLFSAVRNIDDRIL